MSTLNPEQAYLAVLAFLDDYWRQAGQPDEVGMFLGFSLYTPGEGTADPAIWTDWLAAVHKVQTGEALSDRASNALTADSVKPMESEQAYLAMISFIEEYWKRVSRPAEIGVLLGLMQHTPERGNEKPILWRSWLAAVEKVGATRPRPR